MDPRDLTAVVHLVGFATGIILYGMLGVMTRRHLAYVSAPSDQRAPDRVPLLAALLGVVWNIGAMLSHSVRDFSFGEPLPWAAAAAYTALGALPAVVIHSTLNRANHGSHRGLVAIAYGASVLAGVMHLVAAAHGALFSPSALILLTTTYGVILGVLAVTERRQPGFHRTITAIALAAFAVSALHLSRHPGLSDQDPWPIELIGHHASLPLVLAILYQDYRFAFADLFLKRALSVLVLMAVVGLLYATLAAPLVDPHAIAARRATGDEAHLGSTAALLALWSATALAYPLIQRVVFRFVDRVVLRRADYRLVRVRLETTLSSVQDAAGALDAACALIGAALDASSASWREAKRRPPPGESIVVGSSRIDACIVVPTAADPTYEIVIGELRGGRTLLSDDLVLMDGAAAALARRIDILRLDAERGDREQREREVLRLATESELRALRAQLNPHFLFNALNTLGHLMQTAPDRALTTLYRLTGLLRAVLRRSNGQFVSLREELEIVEAYLAIEQERFEERLTVEIDVADDLRDARVPPLILQPLVENAVKHGIAPLRAGGRVTVRVRRDPPDGAGGFIRMLVIDTGRGFDRSSGAKRDGVGLANIESRLRHYYGAEAAIVARETPGGGATVELCVPVATTVPSAVAVG
jgi:two-component system LytT family sensor kinase